MDWSSLSIRLLSSELFIKLSILVLEFAINFLLKFHKKDIQKEIGFRLLSLIGHTENIIFDPLGLLASGIFQFLSLRHGYLCVALLLLVVF